MAATKKCETIPQDQDPKSPFESLDHLLSRCVTGHDTDTESICHYQDVFGHSAVEDLHDASRGKLKEVFYRLYDTAFGTIQTLQFYTRNCEAFENASKRIGELEDEVACKDGEIQKLKERIRDTELRCNETEVALFKASKEVSKKDEEVERLNGCIAELESEIVKLKARLYDELVAKKEKE